MNKVSSFFYLSIFFIIVYSFLNYLIEFTHDAKEFIKYGDAIITAREYNDLNFFSWIFTTEFGLPYYNRFEYGFAFIYFHATKFFESSFIFVLLATITVISKKFIFNRYSYYPNLSIITYLLFFVVFYEASQIRSAIILSFILFILFHPKEIRIWFYALISTLFHVSGLAILQIYFYYFIKKIFNLADLLALLITIFFYILVLIIISFVLHNFQFDSLLYYLYSSPINLLNSNSILQIFILFLLILNFNNLNSVQKKATVFFSLCLLIFFLLFEFSTIAIRIRELSLIAFYPLMFSKKLEFNYFYILLGASFLFIFTYNLYNWIPRLFIL